MLTFATAAPEHADVLADIRVAAMKESLMRLDRFDEQRARDRFLNRFVPEATRFIEWQGERVGFVVVLPEPERIVLDHLYVLPEFQNHRIGSAVLQSVLSVADAQGLPVHVMALKESRSNGFYQRHGFTLQRETEWDCHYERLPGRNPA